MSALVVVVVVLISPATRPIPFANDDDDEDCIYRQSAACRLSRQVNKAQQGALFGLLRSLGRAPPTRTAAKAAPAEGSPACSLADEFVVARKSLASGREHEKLGNFSRFAHALVRRPDETI